ncbi:hypothetical protein [Novosphingobium sp.]|uniref:hypothetical protein n=1 Tax=Novosphingobium sp. TaxID=1874826 RepID=UPI0027369906|nr:hypothetical protein [Novosphingobium sp.]MDP3908714.1 hypothetical protein [Novosphingobium sp.]
MQSDATTPHELLRLPGLLAEIEEVAGRSVAVTIAENFGGTSKEFPVPERLQSFPDTYTGHWLVQAVGRNSALAIVKAIFPNGGRFEIPSAKCVLRRQFVLDNYGRLSGVEIAACMETTERAVRRIKARLRAEGLIP